MSNEQNPLRLYDPAAGAPAALRELLDAGRRDLPSPDQIGRLSAKLGPLLDAPPAPGPGGASSPPGFLGSPKALAALLGAGAVAGGLVWYLLGAQAGSNPPLPTHGGPPEIAEPASKSPVKPAPVNPAGTPQTKPAPEAPAAETSSAAPKREPEQAEASPKIKRNNAPILEKPPVDRKSEPSNASAKPSEAELLQQAQRLLKSNPTKALALTREHQRLYPRGVLVQEREVIAIEALSRLGRKSAAEDRAGEFESKYPGSAHEKKIESTLKK